MLTSKQRAKLKSYASSLEALYQLGKGGVNENYIIQITKALDARELIKIHVLANASEDVRKAGEDLAERTDSEVVHVIGSKIVLYKKSRISEKRELSIEIEKIR